MSKFNSKFTLKFNEKSTLLKICINRKSFNFEFKMKLKDVYEKYIITTTNNIIQRVDNYRHYVGYDRINFIKDDIIYLVNKHFTKEDFYKYMIEYFEESEINDLIYIFSEYDFYGYIDNTVFNNYIFEDGDKDYWEKVNSISNLYKNLYIKYEDLEKEAIYKIENQYLESKYNPKFKMCRDRLNKEYDEY